MIKRVAYITSQKDNKQKVFGVVRGELKQQKENSFHQRVLCYKVQLKSSSNGRAIVQEVEQLKME